RFRVVLAVLAVVVGLPSTGLRAGRVDRQRTDSTELPPPAERASRACAPRFDAGAAMDVVSFMQQYWRVAGNPGFNASIDHIRDGLVAAGFSQSPGATVRVEEFPNSGRGWDYRVGTVEFDGVNEPALLSPDQDRVSLAINSFST